MEPVTDETVLAELEREPITDPALLAQLDGQPAAPSTLDNIGRAAGLTGRSLAEGAMWIPNTVVGGLGGIYNPGLGGIYNPGFGGIRPGFGGGSPFGVGGSLAPMTVPSGSPVK